MPRLLAFPWDTKAVFRARPNRFLALGHVDLPGTSGEVKIHVHDPGRLEDLLFPGNELLLRRAARPNRKTGWDMVAARHGDDWIVVNSGVHRPLAEALLRQPELSPVGPVRSLRAEVPWGDSRLDFRAVLENGETVWIEVKGCTLAVDGVALFPDAPTKRGRRHLEELIRIRRSGVRAAVLIFIFRPEARAFGPHAGVDPEFANTFVQALEEGVEILPLQFAYQDGWIRFLGRLPLA